MGQPRTLFKHPRGDKRNIGAPLDLARVRKLRRSYPKPDLPWIPRHIESVFDVVLEEMHLTKADITKSNWKEIMLQFKDVVDALNIII